MKSKIILTLCLALSGMVGSFAEEGNEAKEKKVLRVATSADQPPYEFFDTISNVLSGFDVDLIREVGKKLGYDVEIVDMDFSGLLPALQTRQVDVVIASMSKTYERLKNIDFSEDYFKPTYVILSLNKKKVISKIDFNEKVVGAQLGTSHSAALKEYWNISKNFQIEERNRVLDLVQELRAERLEAIIIDDFPAYQFMRTCPDVFWVEPFVVENLMGYAIALPKGSELTVKINEVLKELEKEGFLDKLKKKWLGSQ